MKYLIGKLYVEVKDKKFIIHPDENIILRERKEPKILRTQNQDANEIQIGRNKNLIRKEKHELAVKSCPKRKSSKTLLKNPR